MIQLEITYLFSLIPNKPTIAWVKSLDSDISKLFIEKQTIMGTKAKTQWWSRTTELLSLLSQ